MRTATDLTKVLRQQLGLPQGRYPRLARLLRRMTQDMEAVKAKYRPVIAQEIRTVARSNPRALRLQHR